MYATGLRYLPWYPIAGGSGEGDPPPADPPKNDPPTSGDTDGERDEPKFSKAQLATAVQDALRREREKAAADQKKAEDAAEAKRLTEQNEFKALADKHAARVQELEPYQAKAERYEAALTALLTEERKHVPEHLTPLLDRMDPADQLEYLATHRDKLVPTPTGSTGVPATGRGSSGPTREQVINDKVEVLRRSGAYGRL